MPTATRALTRAARERAAAKGIPYTTAREQLLWIARLLDEVGDEFPTFADAEAYVEDPANQTLCGICGWTMGMVCPECSKGCGCVTSCSGWRHREWNSHDDDPEYDYVECPDCGGNINSPNPYDCTCDR